MYRKADKEIYELCAEGTVLLTPALGFDVTNDIFAENAWYFRNSLVRANYNDLKNGIHETTEFLELFLRNLLLNENHPLHNRTLHISGTFKTPEKVNIESKKANIDDKKVNIEKSFTAKTAAHACKLLEEYGFQTIFGRSDVQNVPKDRAENRRLQILQSDIQADLDIEELEDKSGISF